MADENNQFWEQFEAAPAEPKAGDDSYWEQFEEAKETRGTLSPSEIKEAADYFSKDLDAMDAFLASTADTMTFGHYPKIAGHLASYMSDIPEDKLVALYEMKKQAVAEDWPKAQIAGTVAGILGGGGLGVGAVKGVTAAGRAGMKAGVSGLKKVATPQKIAETVGNVIGTKSGIPGAGTMIKKALKNKKVQETIKNAMQKAKTPAAKPKYRVKDGKLVKIDE